MPVTANDQIAIPVGSYVIGHVLAANEPGYLKGGAELLLAFDSIILPDGTTRQIEAVVQSAEGLKLKQIRLMNREHYKLLGTREKKPFLVLPKGPYSGE